MEADGKPFSQELLEHAQEQLCAGGSLQQLLTDWHAQHIPWSIVLQVMMVLCGCTLAQARDLLYAHPDWQIERAYALQLAAEYEPEE